MSDENNNQNDFKDNVKDYVNNVQDSTSDFTEEEIQKGKGMGILSYILPFIPFFAEKENKYVQYHAKQGMNLLVVAIAYSIIYSILTSVIKVKTYNSFWGFYYSVTPWWVTLPLNIISIGISILCIMGIVNVCKGKAKELPLINKVKIFK